MVWWHKYVDILRQGNFERIFNFIIYFLLKNTLTNGLQVPNRQIVLFFTHFLQNLPTTVQEIPEIIAFFAEIISRKLVNSIRWVASCILSIKKRYCFFPVSRKHNAQNAGMAILIVVTASNKPPAQTVLLALYMYARFFPVKCNCFWWLN